ncbi:GMC family oxidoreductase [Variovorax paradoxus]|nr:GMC oxidoreductase [Variovorax paradoxus]MBT2301216.1 GMC family oxidoreductase [Variovorax paradoxus]
MPLNHLTDSGQPIEPSPDVQRTTLGLDALGRYVCSTWDEATGSGSREFDAIVVGAGMFGAYCADRLFRWGQAARLKVLVLDAGAFLLPMHIQNLPNIGFNVPRALAPSADPGVARELVWGIPWRGNTDFVGQAYCIGGKSLYWGGWCPRLLDDDLADWPGSVVSYLRQNYSLLEQQTGVDVRTDFIQGDLFELLKARLSAIVGTTPGLNLDVVEDPPLAVQGQSPASGLFSFDKYSSVTSLIEAVRDAAREPDPARRLFIVPNAHVTDLSVTDGAVSAINVNVAGIPRSIPVRSGCAVVLALGTIESTRLALTSFPTSPTDPSQELMGRNLMAHWRSNIFVRIKREALDTTLSLPSELQAAALLVRGSTPLGRFHIQITASADPGGNADAMLFSMIPDIDQLQQMLASQRSGWITLGFRGVSQHFGEKQQGVPNPDGRWINLSPFETDEFGRPRAYVHLTTTSVEDELADAMDEAILALANRLAGDDPANIQVVSRVRDGLGTTYHEAGTLWMGSSPADSVTDTNGRFHHIANAFCADQALFPSVGSVNPTLTGLVLTRKIAAAAMALATGAIAPP